MRATTTPTTMRVVARDRFGAPEDVLDRRLVEQPTPDGDQVLIRVRAVGISIGDWLMTRGIPYIARPSYGLARPRRPVVGLELAGIVEAVGENVEGLEPGDEVFGFAAGALAQYVTADPATIARKPSGLSFEQAAALPVSALAAYQALTGPGALERRQSVLIVGASGAVGSFAVQLAKTLGAEVSGVASTRNVQMVRELGADHVIDYTEEEIGDSGRHYDLIVDLAGNRPVSTLRRALAPDGTLVIVGGSGGRWLMGFGRTVRAILLNPFVRQQLRPLFSKPNPHDLAAIADLARTGAISPFIDRVYRLDDTAEALLHVGERHTRSKTVVAID